MLKEERKHKLPTFGIGTKGISVDLKRNSELFYTNALDKFHKVDKFLSNLNFHS